MVEKRLRTTDLHHPTPGGAQNPADRIRVAESEVIWPTPTPTFPKFPTPAPQHNVNED